MRKSSKRSAVVASVLTCAMVTVGCSAPKTDSTVEETKIIVESTQEEQTKTKLNVISAIYPEYDWVNQIAGDLVDNTLLLENGVDLHSYQPSAQDIIKLQEADLVIYTGGESDEWISDALKEDTDTAVVNLMELLGDDIKAEEVVEGMEHEHHDGVESEEHHEEEDNCIELAIDADADEHIDHEDEEHHEAEADEEEHHDHGGEAELDEHIWLSVRNAISSVSIITEELANLDATNAETYLANGMTYTAELSELDKAYGQAVEAATVDTIVVADRFPFRYLVDDYGINYYAAFAGCSAETEASFETIVFLANKLDELDLKYVVSIEGVEHNIPQTVIDNTSSKDQEIVALNSLQSVTQEDLEAGVSYISVMEDNLENLKLLLNVQ